MTDVVWASEIELGSVIYLVEDTPDGARRSEWCEVVEASLGRHAFGGGRLGGELVTSLELPDDGRRVEVLPPSATPGFARPSNWKSGRWLVVDTETTGLGPDSQIVELGAVVMVEGKVVDRRNVLVNPGRPIDPGASAVHRIYDRHVAGLPRLRDPNPATGRSAAEGLCAMAAEADAIVGYNLVSFDMPLLERSIPQWSEAIAGLPVLDALVTVRLDGVDQRPKSKGRHKLGAVADWLRLTEPEPGLRVQTHRAAWDCVLAGRILWHLRHHLPDAAADAHWVIATRGREQRDELDRYWASRAGR